MRALVLAAALQACVCQAAGTDWLIASSHTRVAAGEAFEIVLVSLRGEPLPDKLELLMRSEVDERVVLLAPTGPAADGRRAYSAVVPAGVSGTVTLELAGRSSSVLQFSVTRPLGPYEPPLSENDPMYFILGAREGYSARFQLSFKYRLFDIGSGFGRDQPWLSGLYFGYTQNSLWELSSESRAFRDTSYRPQFFWKWDRADEKTFIDSLRVGFEHESNGRDGARSRSINIAFVRPEWHHRRGNGDELQFTPKIYSYLDRDENPDIQHYRGYVDWRLRYDAAGEWVSTLTARRGTAGKGSLLLDLSRRARDLRFGPVGGYFHLQYFNGYGEDILDYNVRRRSQVRIGFAIVP